MVNDKPIIYILSDSLGETGEMVVRAAISQFPHDIEMKRIPYLSTPQEAEEALEEAAASGSMVVYTLVDRNLQQTVQKKAGSLGVPAVDLLGPIIGKLTDWLGTRPAGEPGLIRKLDESYFDKVEAIEFAVQYDDGRDPRSLQKADIVVLGVSRTSKTPLCMYLALRGYKATNVPIVPEVPVPDNLFAIDRKKIFGLMIKPSLLLDIRKERLRTLGIAHGFDYARMERILAELDYAGGIMHKLGCPVIDVTNRAVEDTAHKILEIYRR